MAQVSVKALDQKHQSKLLENRYIDPIYIAHLLKAK